MALNSTVERQSAAVSPHPLLDTKTILRFYLPLAFSWVTMALDGPVNVSVIQRLPHPVVGAAAFTVLINLSMWIESPIIDLLSTATTLATSAARYLLLRRFVLWLIVWVTCAHALVAATPAYWWITLKLLALPEPVAVAARPALILMIPWSGLIGWRRTHQGILIRTGETRGIGIGTALRGLTMALVAVGMMVTTPGVSSPVIAATSLVASVGAEALFIHLLSRDAVRKLPQVDHDGRPLNTRRLLAFHFPLTATTMVNLLMGPLVMTGLARTANPTQSLAGYQDAAAIFFLFRMTTFSLPEIVITLGRDRQSIVKLRKFSLSVGAVGSASLLLLGLTGLDQLVFGKLLNTPKPVIPVAHWTLLACAALPLVDAGQSYVRGVLTAQHRTTSRLVAVAGAISALAVTLMLCIALKAPAPTIVGASITAALTCELTVLVLALRRPLTSQTV